MYDDLVTAYLVEASKIHSDIAPDSILINKALKGYKANHLPASVSKSFGFARESESGYGGISRGDLNFIAWGTQVNSSAGLAGAEENKRGLLFSITVQSVALGFSNGDFLRRLGSNYVHPFQHRKLCMSTFHKFCKYRASIPERKLSKIPADIIDELLGASLQLPVALAHLRWPIGSCISCTDATPLTGAAVHTSISQELALA